MPVPDSSRSKYEEPQPDPGFVKKSKKPSTNPLKLKWCLGFNSHAPVVNLSLKGRSLIAYAASHVAVLYDFATREMFTLQGHRDRVKALSADATGDKLLTASFDGDCSVVVWSTETREPIFTLSSPHGRCGITAAALSPDGKFIVTVGDEDVQAVKVWFWTDGSEYDDEGHRLSVTTRLTRIGQDRVKDIAFYHQQEADSMALTTDRHVAFVTLTGVDRRSPSPHFPTVSKKSILGLGTLNNTTFATSSAKAFTGTTNGFVLVWEVKNPQDNKMKHIKSVQLQKANITRIIDHANLIITGNSLGDINFYDNDLRILYWCRNCGFDSITSISFARESEYWDSRSGKAGTVDDKRGPPKEPKDSYKCSANDGRKAPKRGERSNPMGLDSSSGGREADRSEKSADARGGSRNAAVETNVNCYKVQVERRSRFDGKMRVDKFIVATAAGVLAWIDLSTLKGYLIFNYLDRSITGLDAHPQSDYLVIANKGGSLFLFNHSNYRLVLEKQLPPMPKVFLVSEAEMLKNSITRVSNTKTDEGRHSYATAVKYSSTGELLVCGTRNGVLWILQPTTLELEDPLPYKHSNAAVLEILFSEGSDYLAYHDAAMTVVVLRRNDNAWSRSSNRYELLGKYRSHSLPIRGMIFGPAPADGKPSVPSLLSIAEDEDLIEYDLAKSGPYPNPGLVVSRITRIGKNGVPSCIVWYRSSESQTFLAIPNSEYKIKLFDYQRKQVYTTILGPIFNSPIKKMLIIPTSTGSNGLIFATDKEIGLQLLPFDENPYRIFGVIGHPEKIGEMRISSCNRFLFSIGLNDQCALMWQINFRHLEIMHSLGGSDLSPLYGLIEGGQSGRLFNEMKDSFIFAQISDRSKNQTIVIRDEIDIEKLPKLLISTGVYVSQDQVSSLKQQVLNRVLMDTGKRTSKINFQEFVKAYVNYRPATGVSIRRVKGAFRTLGRRENGEEYVLSRKRFLDVLLGEPIDSFEDIDNDGALTPTEARDYLKFLTSRSSANDAYKSAEARDSKDAFDFLPERLSYKDFIVDILGIDLTQKPKATNGNDESVQ